MDEKLINFLRSLNLSLETIDRESLYKKMSVLMSQLSKNNFHYKKLGGCLFEIKLMVEYKADKTALGSTLEDIKAQIKNSIESMIEEYETFEASNNESIGKTNVEESNNQKDYEKLEMDIFISHSSLDEDIAESLIELIKISLNIKIDKIRCTSVKGYGLRVGAMTDDELRKEIFESKVFIAIVSPNSIKSTYVLFELGARWGTKLPLLPLITKSTGVELLEGPLKNINSLNCSKQEDNFQFVNDLANYLKIQPEAPTVYYNKIEELRKLSLPVSFESKVFESVEIEAQFPGGDQAWIKYLKENLKYPKKAADKNIQGVVVMTFVINKHGIINDIQVESGPTELKDEAFRVLSNSGRWLPAEQNGFKVNAYRRQPITFKLT